MAFSQYICDWFNMVLFRNQLHRMSQVLDFRSLMLSCTKLCASLLSVLIGVGSCRCPNSSKDMRIMTEYCALLYKPPVSYSAADATTLQIFLHTFIIEPLHSGMGLAGNGGGLELRKKCPAYLLRALG